MKKEYKLLLTSSILMFIYVLINIVLMSFLKGKFIVFESVLDIAIISISFVGAIYFLILSIFKVDLKKHKLFIILFSIFFFLFNIISGVLGFIASNKIDKKEKRELPKLDILYSHKPFIYVLDFVICIGLIFFLPDSVGRVGGIISYIVMILLNIIVFYEDLKRDFKYFKEYFREYNILVFKTYLKSLVALFIISLAVRMYTGLSTSTNQESINIMFDSNMILTIFLAVIYAPFVEELLFRGIFRKFIKNKYVFIILSGFIFGLMHVIDDYQSIKELLYIFVYGSLGCFLANLYYNSNNIFTNMYMHFMQNSISVIALLLLKFLV